MLDKRRYDVCFGCGENMKPFVACELRCENCGKIVDCSD